MTREELERAVCDLLKPIVITDPAPEARAVIRLVVEACCDDLKALAGPEEGGLGRLESKARVGVLTAILRLRHTFKMEPE